MSSTDRNCGKALYERSFDGNPYANNVTVKIKSHAVLWCGRDKIRTLINVKTDNQHSEGLELEFLSTIKILPYYLLV